MKGKDAILCGTEMFSISDLERLILKLDMYPNVTKVDIRLGRVTVGC